jgi:N-methylhydantoinase A
MAEMVRLATVRRGLDPRSFSMLASGGAGPLHAAAVGAEVGVRRTIVPPLPGMFSALGATLGEVRHDLAQTALHPIAAVTPAFLASSFIPLKARAEALVEREGMTAGIQPRLRRHADLRFAGQLFELGVAMGDAEDPMPESAEIERRFRDAYRSEFGFDLEHSDVQLVRLKLVVTLPRIDLSGAIFDPAQPGAMPAKLREQTLLARDGTALKVPVYEGKGTAEIMGPALVELAGSIVWIHGTQKARIGAGGAIEIIEGDDQ